MSACSHVFKHLQTKSPFMLMKTVKVNGDGGNVRLRHTDNSPTPPPKNKSSSKNKFTALMKKAKDTMLVMEATQGPLVKFACGTGQAVGTGALVFGTGYGLMSLHKLAKKLGKKDSSSEDSKDKKTLVKDKEQSVQEKAAKKLIRQTYFHMLSSLLVSSASAFLSFRLFRNKKVVLRMGERPMFAIGFGVITPLALATLVHYLPRTIEKEGAILPFGLKELGNLFYAASIGLLAAPLYLLGGQSIQRAIFITAGNFMGLHALSQVAPKGYFAGWGKALAYAVNGILLSFILTLIMRRGHKIYRPLFNLMMHGGLLVYSAHLLYASQALREAAERSPSTYDPVTASMALSMDLLSIYGRLAFLLPPHFTVSREHLFVVPRSYFHSGTPYTTTTPAAGPSNASKPSNNNSKGNNSSKHDKSSGKENSWKPGGNNDEWW